MFYLVLRILFFKHEKKKKWNINKLNEKNILVQSNFNLNEN